MGLTKELTTVDILEGLSDLHQQLIDRRKILEDKISKLDRMEQDILHLIEGSDSITTGQSYNYVKSLKLIREERRQVKNEKDLLISIFDSEMHKHRDYYKSKYNSAFTKDAIECKKQEKGIDNYNARELDLDRNILEQVKFILKVDEKDELVC